MTGYGDTKYSPEYGDTAKTYTAGYGVAKYDMVYGNIAKIYTARYGNAQYTYRGYTSRDTTGYCFMTAISWCSRLPRAVGTSTTEAAMIAAVETAKEAIRVYDILIAIGPMIWADLPYTAIIRLLPSGEHNTMRGS